MKPGTQLMTKDGRTIGNAVIVGIITDSEPFSGQTVLQIECDNGLVQNMTEAEISRQFFIKDRQGFTRVADYVAWVEERRARILKNRTFLKRFKDSSEKEETKEIFSDKDQEAQAVEPDPTGAIEVPVVEQVGS